MTEYRELPDESYGLHLAFLAAGAGAVISALWPVPDQSTRLLMLKFYSRLLEGMSPESALREAQLWLRGVSWDELTNYLHALNESVRSAGKFELDKTMLRWATTAFEKSSSKDGDRPFSHPFYWAGFCCYV